MRIFYNRYIAIALIAGFTVLVSCKTEKTVTTSAQKPGAEKELSSRELREFTTLFMDANKAKILGNFSEAIRLFQESLQIDPTSAASRYEIARIYAEDGNFPAALGYAREAYEIDSDNIWYAQFLGQLYSETGRMDQSIEVFKNIIRDHPNEYGYYFNLGSLLSAQGKYDEALELYDELEKRVGTSEELSLQRQMIYIDKGDFTSALTEIDKLIENNPEELRLYGMKAEIYQQLGREDEARELYEQMLEMQPDNGLVLLSLHDIEKKNGNDAVANEYLKRAFGSSELSIDVKVNILLTYLSAPDFNKNRDFILSLVRDMESAHPNEAKAFAVQGDIYYNLNQLDSARVKFRRAVQLDPNRPPIWQQILTIDSQLNDFESLKSESESALELFPQQPIFYLFNGIASLQLKDADTAIEVLTTGKNLVVDNNKLLGQFYASLGDAYHEQKEHQSSDQAYDMALKYDPSNVIVLNNYAYYLSLRKTNLEKAETMARKANDLSPDVASFQDTYAWVLYNRENYQNALFWVEESLKNGGNTDPTVLEHHGDILLKVNRIKDAVKAWEKALEAGGETKDLDPKIEQFQAAE